MKEEVKERLVRYLNFLEEEIKDYPAIKTITWDIYRDDKSKRREVERWIENIVNSSIDIAKFIIREEGKILPDTYKEIVLNLSLVKGFDKHVIEELSKWVKLRNIVAHQYLDIRWSSIKKFIHNTEQCYQIFFEQAKKYVKEKCSK